MIFCCKCIHLIEWLCPGSDNSLSLCHPRIRRWRIRAVGPQGTRSTTRGKARLDAPRFQVRAFLCAARSHHHVTTSRTSRLNHLALQLVRVLYKSAGGLPQQWCMLEELDGATNNAAIYALTRGWIIIEIGHSICLTDAGRRRMEAR